MKTTTVIIIAPYNEKPFYYLHVGKVFLKSALPETETLQSFKNLLKKQGYKLIFFNECMYSYVKECP